MAHIYQIPFQIPNTVGIFPNFKFMVSYDSLAEITSAGYLSNESYTLSASDVVQMIYNFDGFNSGNYGIFTVSVSEGIIKLSAWVNAANVLLPVVNGDLAIFNGTNGQISDSGVLATNLVKLNTSNTFSASGRLIANKVNGTEASNLVTASGMSGVITTSALTTAGGANYAITWTNTFISAASTVLLTISGGTNTNQNVTLTCVPGSGSATLTIYNNSAAVLNGTIKISYLVI